MNLTELRDRVLAATDVLRVETLDAYHSESDVDMLDRYVRGDPKPDPAEKAPWLDMLRAAADAGRPWKRLRVVNRPVTDYVRYSCEFGYVDNVAAGEDARVADKGSSIVGDWLHDIGDCYTLDGVVVRMEYRGGRFVHASSTMHTAADADLIRLAWLHASPFTRWWAENPHLHRTPTPA